MQEPLLLPLPPLAPSPLPPAGAAGCDDSPLPVQLLMVDMVHWVFAPIIDGLASLAPALSDPRRQERRAFITLPGRDLPVESS